MTAPARVILPRQYRHRSPDADREVRVQPDVDSDVEDARDQGPMQDVMTSWWPFQRCSVRHLASHEDGVS